MIDVLNHIAETVRRGEIGVAKPWVGADVKICEKAPLPSNRLYPDLRFVETRFVGELSWLFTRLRDVFSNIDGYGQWKEEFFGRLGNVATKYQTVVPETTSTKLLAAVLHEAYAMAEEIQDYGDLATLLLTVDNQILDDFIATSDLSAYLSSEETQEFLKSLGLA